MEHGSKNPSGSTFALQQSQKETYLDGRLELLTTAEYGRGFFASATIPANTCVLIEPFAAHIPNTQSTPHTMFKLIRQIIQSKNKNNIKQFLNLSSSINSTIQYTYIQEAHISILPQISEQEAVLYATKYIQNAFSTSNGPVILFLGAIFNHSCKPNVRFEANNNQQMIFTTTKTIKKGDQLFDCYGAGKLSHQQLFEQYNFKCKC